MDCGIAEAPARRRSHPAPNLGNKGNRQKTIIGPQAPLTPGEVRKEAIRALWVAVLIQTWQDMTRPDRPQLAYAAYVSTFITKTMETSPMFPATDSPFDIFRLRVACRWRRGMRRVVSKWARGIPDARKETLARYQRGRLRSLRAFARSPEAAGLMPHHLTEAWAHYQERYRRTETLMQAKLDGAYREQRAVRNNIERITRIVDELLGPDD